MSILPDGFGRVFHSTIAGHGIMAKLVLWNIAQRNAQGPSVEYGHKVVTIKQDDTCPIDSNSAPMEARCTGDDGNPSNLPGNDFYHTNNNQEKSVFDEFCKKMDDRVLEGECEGRTPERFIEDEAYTAAGFWLLQTDDGFQMDSSHHGRMHEKLS
jgi:hypothetical protein